MQEGLITKLDCLWYVNVSLTCSHFCRHVLVLYASNPLRKACLSISVCVRSVLSSGKAMGKAKYEDKSSTVSRNPYSQQPIAEPMPQVPKASAWASSPKEKADQRSSDAPAYISVSKICSDAMIYKNDEGTCLFPGLVAVNQPVFLVTLVHPKAYPQIDFKVIDKLDETLQSLAAQGRPGPSNFDDLAQRLHIVTVKTGTFTPYGLPYHNWQQAFYVAGGASACETFLMELDNCIVYTVGHHDKPKYGQFPVHVQMSVNVDLELTKESFDYPLVEIARNVLPKDMAITPLNVYPPQGVRPLMVHFEVVNANEVALTMFGDTYRHRHALDSAGLERSKEDPTDGEPQQKRLETFYLMTSKDVSVEANAAFVTNLLTGTVENVIIDFNLISAPEEGTPTHTFVEGLKKIPTLLMRGP